MNQHVGEIALPHAFAAIGGLGYFVPTDENFLAPRMELAEPRDFVAGALSGERLNPRFAPGCQPVIMAAARRARRRGTGLGVFDVGGYIGQFGVTAAKILDEQDQPGCVTILEPTPLAGLISRSISLNAVSARIRRVAASAEAGQADYFFRPGERISGRLSFLQRAESETVETVTLDDLWDEAGRPGVVLAKVDTEGHEAAVLSGARRMLSGARVALLLELWGHLADTPLFSSTYAEELSARWRLYEVGNALQPRSRRRLRGRDLPDLMRRLAADGMPTDLLAIPR